MAEVEVVALTPVVPRTEGQVLQGVMKVWNLDKGFGFCTMEDGGADLFVHQSAVQVEGERYRAILPQTPVTCVYYIREGKETAREVTLVGGKPVPGFTSKLEAAQKLTNLSVATRPGMLTGTIKFMNKEKGFGFIVPDAGGEDMFVHVGDIEGQQILQTGEPVQYTSAIKKGNRAQAVEVSCLRPRAYPQFAPQAAPYGPQYGAYPGHPQYDQYGGYPHPGYAPQSGQEYGYAPQNGQDFGGAGAGAGAGALTGKVKWFNDVKGFGFIVPDAGGPDVYFKGADVQGMGAPLTENEFVSYETKSAPDGKVWAGSIFRARPGVKQGGATTPGAGGKPAGARAAGGAAFPAQNGQAPAGQSQQQYSPYAAQGSYPQAGASGSQYQGQQPPQYSARGGAQYASQPQYGAPAGNYPQAGASGAAYPAQGQQYAQAGANGQYENYYH